MTELHLSPASPLPTGEWVVFGASAVGAGHPADRPGNQDAWQAERGRTSEVVVAVADGHGDHRHFRSERGSRLAVEIACRQGHRWLLAHHGAELDAAALARSVHSDLLPPLWADWVQAVLDDVADDPFTETEESRRGRSDDPLIAYGSTLLVAVAAGRKVALAQIGDGDVVVVGPDGRATNPVPTDPALDGRRTTSLCQSDALTAFRAAVVDRDVSPVLLLLLASDGYGNAQIVEDWEPQVGRDLARLVADQGVTWVVDHLEGWVAACASLEGSGDDATVALLVDPEMSARVAQALPADGETTRADATATQTAPAGLDGDGRTVPARPPGSPGGPGPAAGRRRRSWRGGPTIGGSTTKRRP